LTFNDGYYGNVAHHNQINPNSRMPNVTACFFLVVEHNLGLPGSTTAEEKEEMLTEISSFTIDYSDIHYARCIGN
jgi:hypothetical protein